MIINILIFINMRNLVIMPAMANNREYGAQNETYIED